MGWIGKGIRKNRCKEIMAKKKKKIMAKIGSALIKLPPQQKKTASRISRHKAIQAR